MLNYIRGEILSETKITEINMHETDHLLLNKQQKQELRIPPKHYLHELMHETDHLHDLCYEKLYCVTSVTF